MPRTDLTLKDKIELLDTIRSHPLHVSHRKLAVITGVPKSTLSRIRRQEPQLREEWARHEGKAAPFKRKREGKNPRVEAELHKWCSEQQGDQRISRSVLKSKAEEIAKVMGHGDFKATCGWMSRFIARHDAKPKLTRKDQDKAIISTFLENFCEEEEGKSDDERESKRQGCEEENEEDCEEDCSGVPVTPQEAMRCIAGLRRFFMQEGNEGSPVSALSVCADFVEMQVEKHKIQAKFNASL